MKEQPTKPIGSWEDMVTKLLQLYAREMIKLSEERSEGKVLIENDKLRADIRQNIIQVGKILDETEKNYHNLVNEYKTHQD